MIFVTVGAQMPFDRMIKIIDDWKKNNTSVKIFAQIGCTVNYPQFIDSWCDFVNPKDFVDIVNQSKLIVSHAGMGSILTALQYQKPIVVFPRKGSLNETRNDHQIHTAKKLEKLGYVNVSYNENDLKSQLSNYEEIKSKHNILPYASEELLSNINSYLKEWI